MLSKFIELPMFDAKSRRETINRDSGGRNSEGIIK